MKSLVAIVAGAQKLESLFLHTNQLGVRAIRLLAPALKAAKGLKVLFLYDNTFKGNHRAIELLVSALQNAKDLVDVEPVKAFFDILIVQV